MLRLLTSPFVILLIVIPLFLAAAVRAAFRRVRPPVGERGVGATATEELHALLYPSKRIQLEERRIQLVLRDDEHDGAPKRTGIDHDAGTARITLPSGYGPRP